MTLEKARSELLQKLANDHQSAKDSARREQMLVNIEEGTFAYQQELAIQSAAAIARDQSVGGFFLSRTGYPIRETLAQVPLWIIIFPFLLLSCTGLKVRTIYRRARAGACLHCGYDLRGSSGERCSECGRRILRSDPAVRRSIIVRYKAASLLTVMFVALLIVSIMSFVRPIHYDRWPVSHIIAAPAPQWTHVMIGDGCLTFVQTTSGNPPTIGLDTSDYNKASREYELLLRKEVPSGFAFERKMIVPAETQIRLREIRSRLVETMIKENPETRGWWPYSFWSRHSPERQTVIKLPLWPLLLLTGSYPGLFLIRRLTRPNNRENTLRPPVTSDSGKEV